MSRQVRTVRTSSTNSNNVFVSLFQKLTTWTSEGLATIPVRAATTISSLRIDLAAAPGAGTSYTYTLMKSGVATALEVTISDLETSGEDTTNTVTFTDSDTCSLRRTRVGSPAAVVHFIRWQSDATDPNDSIYGYRQANLTSATTRYNGIFEGYGDTGTVQGWASTVTAFQNVVAAAGDLTSYGVILNVAPGAGKSLTFAVYKNEIKQDGSGGTVDTVCTIADAATTGSATFTLPLVRTDRVALECIMSAGSPATGSAHVGVSFSATTAGESNVCGSHFGTTSQNGNSYFGFHGNDNTPEGIEANAQLLGGVNPFTLKGLYVLTDTAPGTGDSFTFDVRLNATSPAGTPTVVISDAATSGSDAVNEIEIPGPTDAVDLRLVTVDGPSTAWSAWWAFVQIEAVELQKVTQLVVLVGHDEYTDEDQPPEVNACVGGGTVASGSNPSDGAALSTSTKLHAWIETSSIGGTVYRWAKVGIPFGNPKTPRVLSFGTLTRALSDDNGGFESSAMTILLSDYDRTLRGLHGTQTLLNQSITVYVADEATIVAGGNPWKVFRGVVRDFRPENELKYRITIEDPLTLSMSSFAQEKLVPPTLISVSDGTADQGLRQSPVPVLYGSLSDESEDTPIGTFEAPFIGTETPAPPNQGLGNLHKHLIGLSACGNVVSVFVADPNSGDPPTKRIKASESEYGDTIFVPHQNGWFLSTDYSVEDDERYTFLYIDQHHPAADLARYNRIPITVNVCGRETTGDGTAATIDALPLQFLHFLNTEIAQAVGDEDWPAIAARDGYSLFDTSTFTTTDTRSEYRIPGGYKGAFILGHSYKQITLREAIKQFCRSGDFAIGVNRHGQIMISMLDVTATAGTVTFTDQSDILKGSFRIDPCLDAVENRVLYVYRRNHLRTLQQVNPVEGARLPREPYDKDWLSGLQTLDDATEQTALGEVRASKVLELEMVRDQATAEDVAARRLALRKPSNGRSEASFAVTLSKGYSTELGDLVEVTHFQGIGATGWTSQRCQVRRIVDDLDQFTRQLSVQDVDDLLDDVAAADAMQWDGDDVIWDGDTVTEFV